MQTIPDSETPIFQEINEELGELPEIDVHDFTEHAFGLLNDSGKTAATAQPESTTAEQVEPSSGPELSLAEEPAEQDPEEPRGQAQHERVQQEQAQHDQAQQEQAQQEQAQHDQAKAEAASHKGGRRRKETR